MCVCVFRNFSLLSFGEEAEEDEEETSQASKVGINWGITHNLYIMSIYITPLTLLVQDLRIRSSHDVLSDDHKLSSQPALDPMSLE